MHILAIIGRITQQYSDYARILQCLSHMIDTASFSSNESPRATEATGAGMSADRLYNTYSI